MQASVIPLLLSPPTHHAPHAHTHDLYPSTRPPRDLCIAAPTGSGKTLAYVVPLIETLRNRVVPRLRALVLLPTRDLVMQVREVLEGLAKGTGLKIAAITGGSSASFAQEQNLLVHLPPPASGAGAGASASAFGPGSSSSAADPHPSSMQGESKVDILLATPGRLIDHLDATPGFTLQHLRFLVLDEADRLLGQSFHEWLPRLMAALDPRAGGGGGGGESGAGTGRSKQQEEEEENEKLEEMFGPAHKRRRLDAAQREASSARAPAWHQLETERRAEAHLQQSLQGSTARYTSSDAPSTAVHAPPPPPPMTMPMPMPMPTIYDAGTAHAVQPGVQKLLFSATLTRDPAKVAALQLRKPVYVSVRHDASSASASASAAAAAAADGEAGDDAGANAGGASQPHGQGQGDEGEYAIPATLREHMVITTTAEKPMVLFHLLTRSKNPLRKALVFTKSVEAARRLHKLLEFFFDESPPPASSTSPDSQSRTTSAADDEGVQEAGAAGRRLRSAYYSSELSGAERARVLREFEQGKIDVLVGSDLIARGMDVGAPRFGSSSAAAAAGEGGSGGSGGGGSGVENVISYDVPVEMRKYVHRVGRTARAGKEGSAWSLVEGQEVRHFKEMMRAAGRRAEAIARVKVGARELAALQVRYELALERLARQFGRQQ